MMIPLPIFLGDCPSGFEIETGFRANTGLIMSLAAQQENVGYW